MGVRKGRSGFWKCPCTKGMNMATLKDVAKLANCDVSTVSRALNNTSYVHPETKARILEAVDKLSYSPNVLTQGLKKGKQHTLGIVVPRISISVYSELIHGVQEEARYHGYSAIICVTDNDPEVERQCLTKLRNSFTDGIIIAATGKNNRLMRDVQASGIRTIQVIRRTEPTLSSITADYRRCASQAVKYLYDKGCRRIALINADDTEIPFQERRDGYLQAIKRYRLEPAIVVSEDFDNRFEDGIRCTEQLLDEYYDLDGIMVSVDPIGLGVLRALRKRGMTVPEDLRLISLTGHDIGSMLDTTMSAMEIPAFDIGKKAASLLIEDLLTDAPYKQQDIVYDVTLTERESS